VDSRPRDRVLIVDDEPSIRDILGRYLRDEGFEVDEAGDGQTAVAQALGAHPAIIILDLNLPVLSGVEAFRKIRSESDVPVIMLTSRINEVDRVVGLELGADDYIGKPFSPREVVARVKAVLRRYRTTLTGERTEAAVQSVGPIQIDRGGHEVHVEGKAVSLTPTEFRILDVLASNIGRAFTRDQLLDKIAADSDVYDRTLDRHIANLRHKIEPDPARPRYLITVFGVGYKLVDVS
jgi:DNA-binding response OmpR family regulator